MENLILPPLPLLQTQKKNPGKVDMVFTIKMQQPSPADSIYGGKVVETGSNGNPGWSPQTFRQSSVLSLRIFLRSTCLGGRRTFLTAVEDLSCVTTLSHPLSDLSLDFYWCRTELSLTTRLYFGSVRFSLSCKENE